MEPYERSKLADALKEETYKNGEAIITEGETGDIFYLIMEGTAVAKKTLEPGKPPHEVYSYQSGEYFGELALLRNEPRAASIYATSDVKVLSLDRHSFKRLMGPMEEVLKRNMDVYKQFV